MLKDCEWSEDRDYKTGSENEPLQFYLDGLSNSTEFNLLLGYFSSAAINLLSVGFASFISKGGKVRMVINHILSEKDKEAISRVEDNPDNIRVFDLNDVVELQQNLDEYSTQFFECLAYLIAQKRIEIKVVRPKKGNGIVHYKSGVFSDGEHSVGYEASCNFTYYGLAENIESLEAFLSWENSRSTKFIKKKLELIDSYFNEKDEGVEYVPIKDIQVALKDKFDNKDMQELLVQEEELLKRKSSLTKNPKVEKTISKIFEEVEVQRKIPKFPYIEGPREYQKEAYKNWVANNYQGMFAMATGTGKTITSLNCVLNEFKNRGYYKFIVLVPTTALAKQWLFEVSSPDKFNFTDSLICSSANSNWVDELTYLGRNVLFERNPNYGIVTTYATFKGNRFRAILNEFFQDEFDKIVLIADEAHNIAAPGFLKVLPTYFKFRIGLSATPERQFDEEGNLRLCNFFSTSPDQYTYEYHMKAAIENEVLSNYYYYPILIKLEQDELNEYVKISKDLTKHIDYETGKYRDSDFVKTLLLKRRRIIHKARRKIDAMLDVIEEIGKDSFKNAFIYVPEGEEPNYLENDTYFNDDINDRLIDVYMTAIYDKYGLKLSKFTGDTGNRDEILENFKSEKLHALLAMKCLDEGVDIPQTKIAIFCSSTGNPRQYIQRRGRVLRNYKKQKAIIYDLIVNPGSDHTETDPFLKKIEKNLFLNELRRLVNFAVLSENKDSSLKQLESICYEYDIDIYELANMELETYK